MYRLDNFKQLNIRENEQGFTLIEVLIAIMLLAFISLYTFKMIDNGTDTKDRVLAEDQKALQGLTAVARIDSDFEQIYSPLYAYSKNTPGVNANPGNAYQEDNNSRGFEGRAKNGALIPQFSSEDKSTLIFFSAANRRKVADAKEGRYAWIKYSLRRSEKTEEEKKSGADNELVRQVISTNIYASNLNWDQARPQILMADVKSVEFSFWDERSKKFVSSILDLNEYRNSIRSLKMEIVWVDENKNEQKITKIYRILYPYFNPKQDDIAGAGAYGDSNPPSGLPNPNDVQNPNGSTGAQQGGSGVHF
jgi:prepilin-type N-terminal cleavage/methylation domain-containing protein